MEKGTWRNLMLAVLTGVAAYIVCVNWLTKQRPRAIVAGPWQNGFCSKLEVSPDGSLLGAEVKSRGGTTAYVFRVSDGKPLAKDLSSWVFSPKRGEFAICDGPLIYFDKETGRPSSAPLAEKNWQAVCFGPEGNLFILSRTGIEFVSRDLETKEEKAVISRARLDAQFDRWASFEDSTNHWHIYDIVTGKKVATFSEDVRGPTFAISADGSTALARSKKTGNHAICDLRTSNCRCFDDPMVLGPGSKLSGDAKFAARDAGLIHTYLNSNLKWYHHLADVFGIPRPVDGIRSGVKLNDLTNGQELAFIEGMRLPSFSADGRTLVFLNADDSIELWDMPLRSAVPPAIVIATLVMLAIFLLRRQGGDLASEPEIKHG